MTIRIYKGHGTSKLAPDLMMERFDGYGFDVDFINADVICDPQKKWMNTTSLLVFGGQSVTQFKEALGYEGQKHIQTYVQEGGHYLGICAGGYFGADMIKFIGSDPNNKQQYTKQNNGLCFFNGLAKGSVSDIIKQPFNGLTDSAAITRLQSLTGEKFHTLYWGGPTFIPYEKATNRRILSYLTRVQQSPLIMGIQNDVGQHSGKATLLGYHPEISHNNIQRWVMGHESTKEQNERLHAAMDRITSEEFEASFQLLLRQLGLNSPPKVKKIPNLEYSFPITI